MKTAHNLLRLVASREGVPPSGTIVRRMKAARLPVLVIFVTALFGGTVRADWEQADNSVAGMLSYCVKDNSCNGRIRDFLTGWIASGGATPADANLQFSVHRLGANFPAFCIPPESFTESGMSRIKTLFAKWADEHPRKLHQTWDSGLVDAMRVAFPCRQ